MTEEAFFSILLDTYENFVLFTTFLNSNSIHLSKKNLMIILWLFGTSRNDDGMMKKCENLQKWKQL